MTLKSTFCCLGILLFTFSVLPCINESGEEAVGDYGLFFGWTDLYAALKRDLKNDGLKMEENLRSNTSFNDRNRYAVALMFLGRSSEAVELLNKLESEEPGHFFIAANLGTAYELAGRNAEALKWINEGIRRNPNDHKGTEWLHAKILEAKIAHERDPAFFEKHSVLELRHGSRVEIISIEGKNISSKELVNAIQYQLSERLQFVKPPDPAVASLLFDYAAFEATTQNIESAKLILKMAADYGYPVAKVTAFSKELEWRFAWERFKVYAFYSLIGVILIAVVVVLYRRTKLRVFERVLKRA